MAEDGFFFDDARVVLHVRRARKAICQLGEIRNAAGGIEFATTSEVVHQGDDVDGLLMLCELNHALKDLAVLGEKEILRAQFFDGRVEGVIVEENCAEDAALRFEIVRKRALDRSVCCGHSLYFRLGLFGMQEAEFLIAMRARALEIFFVSSAWILRVVRWRVNRMSAYEPCEYFGKVENVN